MQDFHSGCTGNLPISFVSCPPTMAPLEIQCSESIAFSTHIHSKRKLPEGFNLLSKEC